MLYRMLGSRGFMTISGVVAVVVVAFAAYFVALDPAKKMNSYCADMPDTIGLYTGNRVTMRGVPVGQVTKLQPGGARVRVDFEVDARYPLAADTAATTLSNTLVADRDLALISAGKSIARWESGTCISKTLTPKSMTEMLDAMATLSNRTLGSDPARQDALGTGLKALNSATAGTGDQINQIITKLGTALNAPDAAIGRLGSVIDALATLSDSVAAHWGDIKSMLTRFGGVLDQVNNELFNQVVEVIEGFQRALPLLNDITTLAGDPVLKLLDSAVPLVRMIGANVGTLEQIIRMIPTITGAFARAVDPQTGAIGLDYAPPRVAVARPDAEAVCAAINAMAPGRCAGAANGLADIQLPQLILGIVGAS